MAPRRNEKPKSAKKPGTKTPKGVKTKRKATHKVDPKVVDKCAEWLDDQKNLSEMDVPRATIDSEEEENNHNDELANTAEFDLPFRQLPRREPHGIVQIMFECEWLGCKRASKGEFITERAYFDHIAEHKLEIETREPGDEEEPYYCQWDLCDFDCDDAKTLVRHLYAHAFHTKIKALGASFCATVKVPPCKLDSKRRNIIMDHKGDYFCNWDTCKESFISMQDFSAHVCYHVMLAYPSPEQKQNLMVKCQWYQCNKSYLKICHMHKHVLKHTGEKVIACYNCGARFISKYKLLDHLKRQMEAVGTVHQCPQCVRCFPFEKMLRTHLKSHVNCFKCNLCDMSCVTQSALVKHIRYRHLKERPYQCLLCEHKAVTKRDLELHMNTHDPDFFLRCPLAGCDYVCKTMVSLKKHQEIKHGGPAALFKCHICDKTFHYSKPLSRHLVSKHNFQHPSGHLRFTYKQDFDCFYRLQLSRVESLEVTKEIMLGQEEGGQSPGSIFMSDSAVSSPIKRVEDFDVMRRYLKNVSKEIAVEIVDMDSDGKKVASKTIQVQEFVAN